MNQVALAAAPEAVEAEIRIAAPIGTVWTSLADHMGDWWPHRFQAGSKVGFEPRVGGRFYEQFDDAGSGALYATVTYLEPGRLLKICGPMGLDGAALYFKTFRLAADGDGTVVHTTATILGYVDDEDRASYRAGSTGVLEALAGWVAAHA